MVSRTPNGAAFSCKRPLSSQAAKEAGAEVIVNMSMMSARSDATSKAARQYWLSERLFDWSGVPTAHLRPTLFAEWLLYLAPMIREGRMFGLLVQQGNTLRSRPRTRLALLSEYSSAPTAHVGKTYPLFGPVELTHPEIAAISVT